MFGAVENTVKTMAKGDGASPSRLQQDSTELGWGCIGSSSRRGLRGEGVTLRDLSHFVFSSVWVVTAHNVATVQAIEDSVCGPFR